MIAPETRRALLANFPAGTPFVIVAPEAAGLTAVAALDADVPQLVIEGLDDLDDPAALLRALHGRTAQARVFALIANAAHLQTLGAFYGGAAPAAAHPLVLDEIDPLFRSAGWNPLAVKALPDEAIPGAHALPFAVTIGAITFNLSDAATLERGRTAGFLVIADRA